MAPPPGMTPRPPHRYNTRRTGPPQCHQDDLDALLGARTRDRTTQQSPPAILPNSVDEVGATSSSRHRGASPAFDTDEDRYIDTSVDTEVTEESEESYFFRIGYFPLLDDDVLKLIKQVQEDPDFAKQILSAGDTFSDMLWADRNVSLVPCTGQDEYVNKIKDMPSKLPKENAETKEERALHQAVWENDLMKCHDDNEAIFQRTILVSLIDRHRFFFWKPTSSRPKALTNCYDFNFEKKWLCWPMPTRALKPGHSGWLGPMPKPDLCISFRFHEVIPLSVAASLRLETRKLIKFEGSEADRVFPFLTVQAKSAQKSLNSKEALYQGLNDASLALHTTYEFFKEAEAEAEFFDKVRFFSVAATSEGMIMRIHRAVEIKSDGSDIGTPRILDDYPLRFEFEEYIRLQGAEFNRQRATDIFEHIIWAYGQELFDVLRKTAKAVAKRFDEKGLLLMPRGEAYYRHEQTGGIRNGRAPTTRGARRRSVSMLESDIQ